jgi:ABC-2 type transport system ATP-binding protein
MSENNVTLSVQNVTKRYGDFTAVDHIGFEVRAGRIFGFLGPNGAGKTTTIRMIVNITAPDEGKIELFGQLMSSRLQDRIGYLPEERGLYKKMKINEQLRYFAALKDIPQKKADERIDYWLNRFGLSEWKLKKASDLSKGMQQKIQFIASVLHEPELIILDEPFSGLDPINVELLIEIVSELKAKGKTIIFSTHQMETAERLCDDIILINRSRKVLGGTLRQVKESFGKDRVALRSTASNELLQSSGFVAKITEHSDEKELLLTEQGNAQQLLKTLIESGADVTKFEIVEPSLNDIFIEAVNRSGN